MSTIKYLYTFEMDEKITDCLHCTLFDDEQGYCKHPSNPKCNYEIRPTDCPLDEMEMEMDESEGDI
jgi:hypothetical protein